MIFLANPSSFHLKTWIEIYRDAEHKISNIFTVHSGDVDDIKPIKIFFLNKILSYVILGLILKIKFIGRPKTDFLHAHGASGYGLTAFISGLPYIATIYGSEILGKHGAIYRFVVKKILERAVFITVTSDYTKEVLISIGLDENKVVCFHTGIDFSKLDSIAPDTNNSIYGDKSTYNVVSIRNCAPHYRVECIIEDFLKFCRINSQSNYILHIIFGNGDKEYFDYLKLKYISNGNVNFINGFLPYNELLRLIRNSDLCINYPITDQLSATLLEAMYLCKNVVSIDLDSYSRLHSKYYFPCVRFINHLSPNDFESLYCDKDFVFQKKNLINEFSIKNASEIFTKYILEKII